VNELFIGVILVVAAGAMEGLFSLGVTRTPGWRWENFWGVGSLLALLLVPWPAALATVPHLSRVYIDVPAGVLVATFLFGIGWGIGGIYWGKAIAAVGMALGISLLMGLITVFGSPVPLAIKDPTSLIKPGGLALMGALGVMVLGVIGCSLAGRRKEQDLRAVSTELASKKPVTPFRTGLLFCVLSGILSASVNFGLVFGDKIAAAARQHGTSDVAANNAIWALVFTGNYLTNACYAFYLMFKNRTTRLIVTEGKASYWLWAIFLAGAWPGGIILFGMAATKMGEYGAYVAFPMMLLCAILFGNLAGAAMGEWRRTSGKTKTVMLASVVILGLAFGIFVWANRLLAG
jgi:L-rhamnose-H+ transport protein